MIYFAGGGWQSPPSSQHWKFCAELVRQVPGLTVTLVSPPLAPSSPAAVTFPILTTYYRAALRQAVQDKERVVLAGDSSGGNLALCLALHGLSDDDNLTKPHALLLISPAVDLRPTQIEGAIHAISLKDPVLTITSHDSEASTWAQGEDPAQSWISPITADRTTLSETAIHVIGVTGGWDILSPAALELRDSVQKTGGRGAWLHWEKQMHCYPLAFMYGIPEAKQSKEWVVDQLKRL